MKAAIHQKFPIPSRLNAILTLSAVGIGFALLIVGSRISLGWPFVGVALLFGLMMIPVYSLLHEADHGILHENSRHNYQLGYLLSLLFVAPYTFFQQCHLGHHKRNRTDYEMFDLHYEHQSRAKRTAYLYLFLVGFHWLLLPLSTLVFLMYPGAMTSPLFRKNLESEGMLSGLYKETIPKIRWECLGLVLFHTVLILGLGLAWQNYLILYLVHSFVWSSQNYVNHAHSQRDIIHGAHNHLLPRWLQWFYLSFNLHLAHHQHPKVPWIHLEQLVDLEDPKRISFFRGYFRLWGGTKLTTEPSPVPLEEIRERNTYQNPIDHD